MILYESFLGIQYCAKHGGKEKKVITLRSHQLYEERTFQDSTGELQNIRN